jgi:hypothetical protein
MKKDSATRLARKLRAEGYSLKVIADELYKKGFKSNQGNWPVHISTISVMTKTVKVKKADKPKSFKELKVKAAPLFPEAPVSGATETLGLVKSILNSNLPTAAKVPAALAVMG